MTAYLRRRKADRPLCAVCGIPLYAASTQGRVTYYYARCPHVRHGQKVARAPAAEFESVKPDAKPPLGICKVQV